MRYDSHILSSITLGVALTTFTPINPSVALFAGIVAGSLLPDIDEDQSYVGRRSLGTATVVKGIFGHRGFTHSLLATFLVFLPYLFTHHTIFLGLGFGYLFHILEDMLSKSGVPLFWFFTKKSTEFKVKIPLYKTDTISEGIVAFLFFVGLVYMMKPFVLTHQTLMISIGVLCLFYVLGQPLSKLKVPFFRTFFRNKTRRKVMLGVCMVALFFMTQSYIPLV